MFEGLCGREDERNLPPFAVVERLVNFKLWLESNRS